MHLPTPGLFTTDPGITRRTPVNMARCSIEACFGFDGLADIASPPTGRLRTNNLKLPGPAPPPPGQARRTRKGRVAGALVPTQLTSRHQLGTGAELPPLPATCDLLASGRSSRRRRPLPAGHDDGHRPGERHARTSASRQAQPVPAVSGMGCGLCGSSRSRMAFNAWVWGDSDRGSKSTSRRSAVIRTARSRARASGIGNRVRSHPYTPPGLRLIAYR